MKLQLYVQQVNGALEDTSQQVRFGRTNGALEDTSQQVLQSLPRVMRDTELLHQEALLLREKMQLVKVEIAKVEQDTGQSMATLEHIDNIKTELQAAKQALHEADNWIILAADLEEVFESGDIESISAKLVSMQQSLLILANVPDYEDRKLQLEGLKNRLEAMASPLLVQAFTSGSIEQSRVFVRIFTSIDRLAQLLKYFHKCQKGGLIQQWHSILEADQDESVTDWLRKFYDALLSNWHEQVKWCGQVFSSVSSVGTLLELYADVLASLDPSVNVCVDASLKQQADQLSFLMDLKQITKHFATNLHAAIEATTQGKSWETITLTQQLSALECNKEDLMDTVQGLGQSIPRAMLILNEANKRCLQFTEGCGYVGLLKAIKDINSETQITLSSEPSVSIPGGLLALTAAYATSYNSPHQVYSEHTVLTHVTQTLVDSLTGHAGPLTEHDIGSQSTKLTCITLESLIHSLDTPAHSSNTLTAPGHTSSDTPVFLSSYLDQYRLALRQLDKQKKVQEDWSMFQMCLTLLQNVGELLNQLKQLDRDLSMSVIDVSRKMEGQKDGNPFTCYNNLLLNSSGQKEFHSLVSSIQEGEEMSLLEFIALPLKKLCSDVHHTTFQVIFAPISSQLDLVQSAPAWSATSKQTVTVTPDLPDFSYVPQEYITQIKDEMVWAYEGRGSRLEKWRGSGGSREKTEKKMDRHCKGRHPQEIGQYLMTLPQHLEPFLLQDNPSLTLALQVADAEYGSLSRDTEGGLADVLLGIIARGTCQTYCENIMGICELTPTAGKQLATDIDYLGNVLEDLGLNLSDHLQQVTTLLRLSSEEYQTKSSGCSPRLVAAVRQMRNITSS
uniref:Conserved oligomeric Golgi complex subunit 7 n=2 Tax=Timema TaxID=61471 RepID=A0A7R9EWG3_9NEOP|nr:unnamed protein product [Timema bartmani]